MGRDQWPLYLKYGIVLAKHDNENISDTDLSSDICDILKANNICTLNQLLKISEEKLKEILKYNYPWIRNTHVYIKKFIDCVGNSPELFKLFNVNPSNYSDVDISLLYLSYRTKKCLIDQGIRDVEKLLEITVYQISTMKNLGVEAVEEIYERLSKFLKNPISYSFMLLLKEIRKGVVFDIDDLDISVLEKKEFSNVYESYKIFGEDYLKRLERKDEQAFDSIRMLHVLYKQLMKSAQINKMIKEIDDKISDLPVSTIFKYYKISDPKQVNLLDLNISLRQLIQENYDSIDGSWLESLLKWCCFNIDSLRQEFHYSFLEKILNEKTREVLLMRCQKVTLDKIGKKFNFTREAARQFEAKGLYQFSQWFKDNDFVKKLFLLLQQEDILLEESISEAFKDDYQLLSFLLRNCLDNPFRYDSRLKAYTKVDEDLITDIMVVLKKELDNIIQISDINEISETYCKRFSCSPLIIQQLIKHIYIQQGQVMYKGKKKKESFYPLVIKEYFPNGMHIYDDDQMKKFRKLYKELFDVALNNKNDHSIQSILQRVCVPCDKGTYLYKYEKVYLSDDLKKRINDYVEDHFNSTYNPIIFLNTIYSAFEKELVEIGITNRYFLHGVLKNEHNNDWYFTRDYITKDQKISSTSENVVKLIKDSKKPITKSEIIEKIPGQTDIMLSLAMREDEKILNYFGKYFYATHLSLTSSDKYYLKEVIEKCLKEENLCHINTIYAWVVDEHLELLKNNYIYYSFSLFSLLNYLFKNEYNFVRPFISYKEVEINNIKTLFDSLFLEQQIIEVSSIVDFSKKRKVQINSIIDLINSHNDTHLLVDKDRLVPINDLGIDEKIYLQAEKVIISEMGKRNSMLISELTCFDKLPTIKHKWSEWLIYSCVKKYSQTLEVSLSNLQFNYSNPIIEKKNSQN